MAVSLFDHESSTTRDSSCRELNDSLLPSPPPPSPSSPPLLLPPFSPFFSLPSPPPSQIESGYFFSVYNFPPLFILSCDLMLLRLLILYLLHPSLSLFISSSYCYEAEDGIEPETEFMFDLQLPSDFVPTPSDGEVSDYYLWNIEKVRILSHSKLSNEYQYEGVYCVRW